MVDPALEMVGQRAAAHMRALCRWLIKGEPDDEDAAFYALLVRAEILVMAEGGNLAHLGVFRGEQMKGLRITAHVHRVDCGCENSSLGDVCLTFDWSSTPLVALANRPDPPEPRDN